jgi:hypothetical protein
MPFAPKILSDTYSTMSCPFEMGNEPLAFLSTREESKAKVSSEDRIGSDAANSVSSIRTESTVRASDAVRETAWWPGGRPPKGKIAWIDEERLVIVGAGWDARWEVFVVGYDRMGKRGVERRGWRRILEDEGVD